MLISKAKTNNYNTVSLLFRCELDIVMMHILTDYALQHHLSRGNCVGGAIHRGNLGAQVCVRTVDNLIQVKLRNKIFQSSSVMHFKL